MSTIERFYTTSIAVSRMNWTNDSGAIGSQGNFMGHIQQSRPDFAESIGEAWGQTFLIWCAPETNVKHGDSLTIASGAYAGTYNVKNISTNVTGGNPHLELVVIKDVA